MSLIESIGTDEKASRLHSAYKFSKHEQVHKGAERLVKTLDSGISAGDSFGIVTWTCHLIPYFNAQVYPSVPTLIPHQICWPAWIIM